MRTVKSLCCRPYNCGAFNERHRQSSMNAIVNYEKPVPKDAIIVELDEMWHYLGSKNSSGYGKLIAEKLENSSIGNAVAVIKKTF